MCDRVGSALEAGTGSSCTAMTGAGAAEAAHANTVLVGAGARIDAGVGAEPEPEAEKTEPSSPSTSFGSGVLPEKNSAAVSAGSAEGAGGKMSDWKESEGVSGLVEYESQRHGHTFPGTMKAIASMEFAATLSARATSQSETERPRRGRKHIPRWGLDDLYSASGKRLSFPYS